jgi:amidohydrolase
VAEVQVKAGEAFNVVPDTAFLGGTLRSFNRRVRELARTVPGVTHVTDNERTMGSEDMAYLMDSVPGCYFFVGSNNAEMELNFPHHHPRFDFDERALVIGAALMARAGSDYVMG